MQSGRGSYRTNQDDCDGGNAYRPITLCRASKRRLSPTKVSSSKPQSEQVLEFDISCLPDELLIEILVRLPVKSVFRFKWVSKHWSSLISDPSFARKYISRKINSASLFPFRIMYRFIYVSGFPQILDRLRPDSPNVCPSENFSVLFLSSFEERQKANQFTILAASSGLILFRMLGPLIYYVCDPVTRQWVSLPRPRSHVHSCYPEFIGEGLVTLLNRKNVVTSYKVVRVGWLSVEPAYLYFQSFSSETGEWKDYRLSCSQPVRLFKWGRPVLFNGAMHWFTYGNGMVAFDPYKTVKECRLIKLPNCRDIESEYKYDGPYRLCEECQGQLRYFEAVLDPAESFCFRMWILKDYDKAEWNLVHQVTRIEIWSDDPHISSYLLQDSFIPLVYHPFNLDIVYLRCAERSCIVAYNIKTKRLEVSCIAVGIVEDLSWQVVMPFVLPMWPTPLPKRSRRGIKRSRRGNAICANWIDRQRS